MKENTFDAPGISASSSGTHGKPPPVEGMRPEMPEIDAAAEVDVPGRRRTFDFTRPYPPSGVLQQKCHIALPCSFFVQGFELISLRQPPTAAGNVQTGNPFFGLVPGGMPVGPDIPFQTRLSIPDDTGRIFDVMSIPDS